MIEKHSILSAAGSVAKKGFEPREQVCKTQEKL